MTTPVTNSNTQTAATQDAAAATSKAFGTLGPDAFLKLLVAQMKYQNPFNPSDPSAMLGQVAQFTQVEALQKMQASQTSTASLEQARMASEVIGRKVTGTDAQGKAVSGTVSSARFTSTGPMLVLDSGKEMALANMETMAPGAASPAATASAAASASSSSSSSDSGSGSSGGSTPSKSSAITAAVRATAPATAAPATSSAPTPVRASGGVRDIVADITTWSAAGRTATLTSTGPSA